MEKVYWLLLIGEELYNDVETKKHRGEKVRKQNVTKQKTKVAEQMNRIERDQKKERSHERKKSQSPKRGIKYLNIERKKWSDTTSASRFSVAPSDYDKSQNYVIFIKIIDLMKLLIGSD